MSQLKFLMFLLFLIYLPVSNATKYAPPTWAKRTCENLLQPKIPEAHQALAKKFKRLYSVAKGESPIERFKLEKEIALLIQKNLKRQGFESSLVIEGGVKVRLSPESHPLLLKAQQSLGINHFEINITHRANSPLNLGAFSSHTKTLSLPPERAVSGLVHDGTFLHELHHSSTWRALILGKEGVLMGTAQAVGTHRISRFEGYETFLSLDELSAYRKTLKWAMNGLALNYFYTEEGLAYHSNLARIIRVAGQLQSVSRAVLDIVDKAQAALDKNPTHFNENMWPVINSTHFRVTLPLEENGVIHGTLHLQLLFNTKLNVSEQIHQRLTKVRELALKNLRLADSILVDKESL